MTKRERDWRNRKRGRKFINKLANACADYQLYTLKMDQLIYKGREVPNALVECQEDAIKEMEQLLK